MFRFNFSEEFIKRFSKYLSSAAYTDVPVFSKTEYWKHHSKQINVDVSKNEIIIDGKSGFYFPPLVDIKRHVGNRAIKLFKYPSRLIPFLKRKFSKKEIELLSHFDAFDKIMKHDPLADVKLSKYGINFKNLSGKPGSVASTEEMKKRCFLKHKYRLCGHLIRAHYFYNIINGYMDLPGCKSILEIGPGNGNLSSLLHNYAKSSTIVIVDLPETLCCSIIFLADLFPDAKILMPHETGKVDFKDYDFVFLTPSLVNSIADNSIDLAISTAAFQEMTHEQINEYFQLVQRCCRNNSHFFVSSRVEKIPSVSISHQEETAELPNRFSGYPWDVSNEVLIYEICRLTRLTQLDNCYIRLERIKK